MTHQRKLGNNEQKDAQLGDENENSSNSRTEDLESPLKSSRVMESGGLLSILVMCVVYTYFLTRSNECLFASRNDIISLKLEKFPCSEDYEKQVSQFKDCVPKKCGRFVTDEIISGEEASQLLRFAKKIMTFGGLSDGANQLILDSGLMSKSGGEVSNLYERVREKIHHATALNFGIEAGKLHLAHPTLLIRKTANLTDSCIFHVDKEYYTAFHYTSELYLNDYGDDFKGGRFIFAAKPFNLVMEPKSGRLAVFTSGAENTNCVEKVTSGVRFSLVIGFTCDEFYGIEDPSLSKLF